MDQDAQQQIIERLQQANNVLITVSSNPSVDQLASCIGFTLLINKLGKHGTAVFSGKVPSTLEFLKPEDTIETNTDSLRDFIIALDKSKADKLRYKVEDDVVRIFITPYKTSIGEKDLDFSQGDFNVDVVVAIGVRERSELDQAITAHGRILHDATIISVNNQEQGSLGTLNWVDLKASSLSEMLVTLGRRLSPEPFDAQMATAFMTGVVAETDRFSNSKTNPRTMSLAADLMNEGANQQLIAAKLEGPSEPPAATTTEVDTKDEEAEASEDGSLRINHDDEAKADDILPPVVDGAETAEPAEPAEPAAKEPGPAAAPKPATEDTSPPAGQSPREPMATQPPTLGGQLTANSRPEALEPSVDPLSGSNSSTAGPAFQPILRHPAPAKPAPAASLKPTLADLEKASGSQRAEPPAAPTNPAPSTTTPSAPGHSAPVSTPPPASNDTPLAAEKSDAPAAAREAPAAPQPTESLEEAREAVNAAIASSDTSDQNLSPVAALGAQPLGTGLHEPVPPTPTPSNPPTPPSALGPSALPGGGPGVNPNIPSQLMPKGQPTDLTAGSTTNPAAPPPVPPPMLVPNDETKPGPL